MGVVQARTNSNVLANVACPCGKTFTKVGFAKHVCDQKPPTFKCEFCKHTFASERSLINHTQICTQARRLTKDKDTPGARRAFMAYEHFYTKAVRRKKPPTYEDFAKSTFYEAFHRFGKYTIDVGVINLIGFVDFLLRIETPIDRWTDSRFYSTYIVELNKNEPAIDALERTFKVMQQWAIENDEDWQNFFRKIEPPRAALWITNGKISPWVLFTASSAHDLMARFPPEQASMVERAIDPNFWQMKLQRNQQEVEIIRSMLSEHGI